MIEKIVEIRNISKKYRKKWVLDDISLTVNSGDRIGIVGSNGAGKTTLCETIAQLRVPTKGEIIRNYQKIIGMQLQDSRYPKGITANDILELYVKSYNLKLDDDVIKSVLQFLEIEKYMNSNILKLSGGQQQKINIFLALIINPDLVILDELANGLDIEIKDNVYNLIASYLSSKSKSLILISHNMEEIERFCNEVIFLSQGKIQKRILVKEILKEYESLEKYVRDQFKQYQEQQVDDVLTTKPGKNENWKKLWGNNKND